MHSNWHTEALSGASYVFFKKSITVCMSYFKHIAFVIMFFVVGGSSSLRFCMVLSRKLLWYSWVEANIDVGSPRIAAGVVTVVCFLCPEFYDMLKQGHCVFSHQKVFPLKVRFCVLRPSYSASSPSSLQASETPSLLFRFLIKWTELFQYCD